MGIILDAFGRPDLMSKNEMQEVLELLEIASIMSSAAKDVLLQLRDTGPVEDGDLISKSGRDELLGCGAAEKIAVKGQQGFQACTYKGWDLAKLIIYEREQVKTRSFNHAKPTEP